MLLFYCILNQINAVLVRIRDFTLHLTNHKLFKSSVYVFIWTFFYSILYLFIYLFIFRILRHGRSVDCKALSIFLHKMNTDVSLCFFPALSTGMGREYIMCVSFQLWWYILEQISLRDVFTLPSLFPSHPKKGAGLHKPLLFRARYKKDRL